MRPLIVFFLLISVNVFCQKPTDKINPSAINFSLIDRLYNEKLNELRKTKSVSTLSADPVLRRAAQDQADFMNANDTLTHFQKTPSKKDPAARVVFYKGTHDGVGENCLFTFLLTTITSKNKKDTFSIHTYSQAAEQLFLQWKNSPGHYKNMIEPKYDLQGIAFSYNPASKKLYAAQVFGMQTYTYPQNISALLSDYMIKPYNASYCNVIKEENVEGVRLANRIYVYDNKVYFNIQNIKKFQKTFQSSNDMLAIDIVFKDQFVCEKNNRLNGSPYYDGLLLKPVSFQDLFKRNTGKQGRLNAFVCDLPKEVNGMNFQLNVILIKNGCFCSYTYPVIVESQSYDLIDLQPFWDTITTPLKADTFNVVIKQRIQFDKSKSEIDEKSLRETESKLAILGKYATSVKLNAYSSVEGDEAINEKIQERRANVILQKLNPLFPKTIKPEIVAKENWDMFYDQIRLDYFRYLNQFDKKQIKAAIKDSLLDRLEKFLSAERYAEFEIRMEGKYSDTSNIDVLNLALMKALRNNDLSLAYEIQSKMISRFLNGKGSIDHISQHSFPDDLFGEPYIINLLAAKAMNPNDLYFYNKAMMKNLFKKFESNKRAQYNFCIYAINYWAVTEDTLIAPKKLEELVIKCKSLAPEGLVNSMLLNYHLAAVHYYGSVINDFDQMVSHLNAIHDLFRKVKLDIGTAYKLALYFCEYNATDWAVQLMEPYMTETKNERYMHLYLAAGAVEYHNGYPKVYTDAVDKYILLFPKEYKKWVADEYQLMREDIFKTRYCKPN